MKILEKHFFGKGSVKDFEFTQIDRKDDIAIYEVKLPCKPTVFYYDVIKVKVRKAATVNIGGNVVKFEEHEQYPSDEKFGVYAWNFRTLDKAEKKFKELCFSHAS